MSQFYCMFLAAMAALREDVEEVTCFSLAKICTSSSVSWKHFSALLVLCAGNSTITGEFQSQRPVTRNFDVFFYLRLKPNGCVNNRDAGYLRRHRTRYDITVMVHYCIHHCIQNITWMNCTIFGVQQCHQSNCKSPEQHNQRCINSEFIALPWLIYIYQ